MGCVSFFSRINIINSKQERISHRYVHVLATPYLTSLPVAVFFFVDPARPPLEPGNKGFVFNTRGDLQWIKLPAFLRVVIDFISKRLDSFPSQELFSLYWRRGLSVPFPFLDRQHCLPATSKFALSNIIK